MADNINREHFLITYEVDQYQQTLQKLTTLYEMGSKLEKTLSGKGGSAPRNTKADYEAAINSAWSAGDKNMAQKLYNQSLTEGITWES